VLGAVSLAGVRADSQGTAPRAISLRFAATVDSLPFACGTSYHNIGRTHATITPSDLRLYIHDVRLIGERGEEVAVQLQDDSLWQSGGVALLDFENGSGPCSNGNADMRDVVLGSAPAGRYTGVRFAVGVPFSLNHLDLTQQSSPLSLARMFWAWNSGQKFLRVDMATEGGERRTPSTDGAAASTWMIHLGSTECMPAGSASTIPTQCRWENRPVIAFEQFDVDRDLIDLNLGALLRAADVIANQPKTAVGCMSGQTDRDCAPIFAALGLSFAGAPAGPQHAFRVVRGAPASAPAGAAR
jgi:uncharacterized repeat protein (TIGR04052 family)